MTLMISFPLRTLFFITIVILGFCLESLGGDIPVLPGIAQIDEICLTTRNGWCIRFYSDGWAVLIFGSSFGDDAIVPQGAVLLQTIYNLVAPHLVPPDYGEDSIGVWVADKGGRTGTEFSLTDQKLIIKLFSDVKSKAIPRIKERFDLLLRVNPLPGEKPKKPETSSQVE